MAYRRVASTSSTIEVVVPGCKNTRRATVSPRQALWVTNAV